MSKELFDEASKWRTKKQEARREKKFEQELLEWKSLDIRDGAWKDFPPPWRRGGIGVRQSLSPPLPAHKKISGNCVFAKSDATQE